MKRKKPNSKEVGLDVGLLFFKFFLKSEYLHYGYFSDNLAPDISNLKKAQENYTNLLLKNIPEGVESILDVGCGTGRVAEELLNKGYQVDALSPECNMTDYAKKKLGNKVDFYEACYQDADIKKKYDLVLFSESFQYIPMDQSFAKCMEYLKDGGHILICDFFKTDAPGRSPLGGGHKLSQFKEVYAQFPVELITDQDLTDEIAPTMQIVNDLTLEVIKPIWDILMQVIAGKFPWIYRILSWKFRKKIDKLENKHFKGERNPENFKKYKSYRLILFKKQAEEKKQSKQELEQVAQ